MQSRPVRRGLDRVTVAVLAFCAGLSVSFFTLPLWITFAINVAREGNRSDWIGLFGSVLGAIMTLIAAAVAWFAVQEQIQAQESDKQLEKEEAKFAAVIVLTQPVHAAAAALNIVDQTLTAILRSLREGGTEYLKNATDVSRKKDSLAKCMTALAAATNHFSVSQAWQGLGVEDIPYLLRWLA
jgi:hypothetical protein